MSEKVQTLSNIENNQIISNKVQQPIGVLRSIHNSNRRVQCNMGKTICLYMTGGSSS
jgi:hypothetical protein